MRNRASETCRTFIDMAPGDGAPRRGEYLVTVGKRVPGSSYQILAVRQARRRDPAAARRFHLTCLRAPDVIARVSVTPSGGVILPRETVWWMRGYPRSLKRGSKTV